MAPAREPAPQLTVGELIKLLAALDPALKVSVESYDYNHSTDRAVGVEIDGGEALIRSE